MSPLRHHPLILQPHQSDCLLLCISRSWWYPACRKNGVHLLSFVFHIVHSVDSLSIVIVFCLSWSSMESHRQTVFISCDPQQIYILISRRQWEEGWDRHRWEAMYSIYHPYTTNCLEDVSRWGEDVCTFQERLGFAWFVNSRQCCHGRGPRRTKGVPHSTLSQQVHKTLTHYLLSLWEVWFYSTLGLPIPELIGPSQWCTCNAFHYDRFGDHLQTCRVKSAYSQVHGWVVYRLGEILGSVGQRVKIHKITPVTGKERGDLEIKDYVILQKTSRTDWSSSSSSYSNIGLHLDSYVLWKFTCLYINRPDPIVFLPVVVDTTGRLYDDFSRLLFLHANHEALAKDIPEESDQFGFLRAVCNTNIKGSVGLIMAKTSTMRISIPLDLSSRPFIPLPCFLRSRRPLPLLAHSLVFTPRCLNGTWGVFV